MNFWNECIREAFADIKINASDKQIQYVIEAVQGAYENYYQFNGDDVAFTNVKTGAEIELDEMKQQRKRVHEWINSTTACISCTTTGVVSDGWGRDMVCPKCDGDGRHL